MTEKLRRSRKPFVHLLGAPTVKYSRQNAGSLQQKHWALLAYMLGTNQTTSRDALVTLLWPNALEKHGKLSLRVALTALRKEVGDALQTDHISVGIDTTKIRCDVSILRSWHKAGAAPDNVPYDLNVTRDFMDGLFLKDAPEFMNWLSEERDRIRSDAHNAWMTAAQAIEETLGPDEALPLVETASQIQPWEEATHRTAIRILANAGRPDEAVQRYFQTERELAHHLDTEPSSETHDLIRAVRQRLLTPETAQVTTSGLTDGLPRSEHGLIGRELDLLSVLDRLEHLSVPLFTIAGPPGVGTSALAYEAARLHARTHGIKIHYISMSEAAETASARRILFEALKLEATNLSNAMILLDNVAPGALAANLLDETEEAFGVNRFLAAAHTRMGLEEEEEVWTLSHLPTPPLNPSSWWDFKESPSVVVFLAAATRSGWTGHIQQLPQKEQDLIHLTCRTLQGHPLSLVHAGRAWAQGQMTEPLVNLEPIVAGECVDESAIMRPEHRSLLQHGMRFVRSQPSDVQEISKKYALVGVPFTCDFIASIWNENQADIRQELRHLTHVGMVSRNPGGHRPGTYVLPPQIRAALMAHGGGK